MGLVSAQTSSNVPCDGKEGKKVKKWKVTSEKPYTTADLAVAAGNRISDGAVMIDANLTSNEWEPVGTPCTEVAPGTPQPARVTRPLGGGNSWLYIIDVTTTLVFCK